MPRHPNPVTQADYDRVKELHAQGLGRHGRLDRHLHGRVRLLG